MVQSVTSGLNTPSHAVMFDSYYPNSNRRIKATYSNGLFGPGSMMHNVGYGYDPIFDNSFRFVGNAADSARWTREYNELMQNRPLVEHAMGGKVHKKYKYPYINVKRNGGRISLETL